MNRIERRFEEPNQEKTLRKISSELRKDSNEIDVITSENTPKSHCISYKLTGLDWLISNNPYQNEEKNKEHVFDIIPNEKYNKPSPLTARYNKVSDWMNRFKEFKDGIYDQSPMPWLPFIKRDSSIGEEGLIYPTQWLDLTDHKENILNTPKPDEINSKISLISLWLKSSVNPKFVQNSNHNILEDEDMEEPPVIREFSLAPHQQDEELSDNDVDQRKSNYDNEDNGTNVVDSICEIFGGQDCSLLEQYHQPKKVLKRNKKIHKNIDYWPTKNSEMRIKIAKRSESLEKIEESKPQGALKTKSSLASKNKLSSANKSQQKSAEKGSSSSSKKRETKLMLKASELSCQDLIESNGEINENTQSNAIRASLRSRKRK